MPNSTPRRSAHALPNRDCAPQSKAHKHQNSDRRFREAFRRSQAAIQATPYETALFVRYNQAFIDDIFNYTVPERLDREGGE